MKKSVISIIVFIFLFCGFGIAMAKDPAPPKIMAMAYNDLANFGTDPVIVNAVKTENAKGKTLDQIKDMDAKWRATPGIADFMKPLLESDLAGHLLEIYESQPYYAEIFVMDKLGANVAMTGKTSDYWQGDEAKFQEPFKTGKVFVEPIEFDDSTQAYIHKISVPVKDGDTVIGAVTFGIELDRVAGY